MLPPQAPPAVTSQASQAAVDTLQRLGRTQAWLAAQQHELLARPLTADDPDSAWEAFWQAPVEHVPGLAPVARREAFALRLTEAAKDIASLRAHDATLSGRALELIHAVANHPPGALPAHIHAFELTTGGVAYAGALALKDYREPGLAMLFTVRTGWETFTSLDEIQREFETRLREQLASGGELPGAATSDIQAALDDSLVGIRSIDRDPFDVVARRLIDRAAERMKIDPSSAAASPQTAGERMDLHGLLDIHAMVAQRDTLLANALQEERLAKQPTDVRSDWLAALDAYVSAGNQVARLPPRHLGFADFAREALTDGLLERGHDVDPGHIVVRVSDIPDSPTERVSAVIEGRTWETMSLFQFALRNIGGQSTESIQLAYPDGSTRTDVPVSTLKDLVRTLDLPHRYARHLDDALSGTVDGKRTRALDIELLRARMRFDAAEARMGYADAARPRGFLPDRTQRGFRWVKAIIENTNSPARAVVDGQALAVRQLMYRGAPLAGVLLIAPRSTDTASRVVLYTPDAPDGVAFREFENRARLARDFLRNPFLESYLVERLPIEFSAPDSNGIRRFTVSWSSKTAQWAFGDGDCGFCTRLEENFTESDAVESPFDTFYDTSVALAKRDAHHIARSTSQADRESLQRFVGLLLSPYTDAGRLFGEAAWSVLKSIPRTAQAGWRFYDSVKAGDGTQAFLDFVDGYTSAINVVGLHALPRATAGSIVRAGARSGAVVRSGKPVSSPGALFEERFVARGVVGSRTGAGSDGIDVVNGARYIRQAGKSYQVAFDPSIDSWRLTRPGAPDANFTGPAIQRSAGGLWEYRDVGLLGGGRRLPKSHGSMFNTRNVSRWERSRHRFTAELEALSPQELVDLQADLYIRLGHADGNRVFAALGRRRLPGVPGPRVSAFEEAQWDLALLQIRTRRNPPAAQPSPRGNAGEPRPGTSAQAAAAMREPPTQGPPMLEGFERIPASELPEEVFYYATPRELAQDASTFFVTLLERRITLGVQGVPLLTAPPTTPLASLDAATLRFIPRAVAQSGSSLGSSSGAWVRLRLREAHAAETEFGSSASFEAFRSTTPGSTAVVLRRPGAPSRVGSPEAAVGFFGHYSIHFAPR